MKVRRLMASVSAGFDDFVNRVENHEAVADCAIDELRQATARVRVQQSRTALQVKRLDEQVATLEAEAARWRERALRVADGDETKGLECVRRARRADVEREALDAQRTQHRALADDLAGRLRDLERRLGELQLKRTALASRAARAQTLRKADRCGADESLDAVFDRWETVVTADEYRDGVELGVDLAEVDSLERELADEEDLAALRAGLEELRARAADGSAPAVNGEDAR